MKASYVCLGFFLLGIPTLVSSISQNKTSWRETDAASRAYQTLEGLFNFYWKADPKASKIEFLFVCGQVGGWGYERAEGQCSCDYPKSCVNCYRWYDAVALESIATYGIYTNTTNHSEVADVIFDHSPYNAEWNATASCTFMDDFSWYGIAYLRVYEWLKDPKWLNRSIALYDWAWQYGWDDPCGGFWWSNCKTQLFKDSITIVEMLHLSAKLAYMFPNESHYFTDSMKIWNWIFSFDNGRGLMSDKYLVSTGVIPEKCCNSTSDSYSRCYNTRLSGTSYNQGLLMSATAYLYLRTGNTTYLKIGNRLLDAVLENYTKDGILIDEPRSYQSFAGACWGGSDPGGDWYSFNGVFMLHLGYYTDLLSLNKSLGPEILEKIKSLVDKTGDSAWNNSAVWSSSDVAYDGCNIGVSPALPSATYPKFHWWWAKEEIAQVIPPDPKYFFHRRKLACKAMNGSKPLWKGKTKTEDACKEKCKTNEKCLKYQFKITASHKGKINCWLWSFNRSNHICQTNNLNMNIGIKRPVGNATCSGRCGDKEPQKVDHGVCYCDSNCPVHMDCCLDYADHCQPAQPIQCKGRCGTLVPSPIPQGGYCWCFDGCNGWFTDNNSDGSCCYDYPPECMAVAMPVCLDARTQGSALNLFLTQMKVASISMKLKVPS